MKGPLLPAALVLAVVATAVLGLLALRGGAPGGPQPPAEKEPRAAPPAPAPAPSVSHLRAYETTATLTEDLRDVLATGDAAAVHDECWRVSSALRDEAAWMLRRAAPAEASPRVRALLVLACGVHVPDDPLLLAFLADPAAPVRAAAALASGYRPDAVVRSILLESVSVPLGREPAARTQALLRDRLGEEEDEGVRGTIRDVLAASSRR